MRIKGCIFVDTPRECSSIGAGRCLLDSRKLPCLLNHRRLKIGHGTRNVLHRLLTDEMNSPSRVKVKSGEEVRQLLRQQTESIISDEQEY